VNEPNPESDISDNDIREAEIPVPDEPRPVPTPRRSTPVAIWMTSGDFVMSHVPTTNKPDWLTKIDILQHLAEQTKYSGMQNTICHAMIDVIVKNKDSD